MAAPAGEFVERYRVGWGDLDGNQHLANRAILDRAADTRIQFMAKFGFTPSRFAQERVGPVILREELVYRKELRLGEEFTVDLRTVAMSADALRFEIRNTFRNSAGEVTATVTSEGLWFDLERRKPRAPPPDLASALRAMPRDEGFREMPARG